MIRILQISDIHWKCEQPELDDFYNFRKAFLRDIADYVKERNVTFDCMFVCGDIAFSGQKEQYESAAVFLKKTCEKIGCDCSMVYIVPGNHDKNCDAEGKINREALHHQLSDPTIGEIKFQELKKISFEHVKSLYAPFAAYNEFVNQFKGIEKQMDWCVNPANEGKNYDPGHSMYWNIPIAKENGYEFVLWGINTCLVSDLYDYRIKDGKEIGHKQMLMKLAYRIPAPEENQIAISMMHHPKDCIANGKEVADYLDTCCKIQLYGHAHLPYSEHVDCVKIYSGALQPPERGDDYYPVYNIITLEIEKGNDGYDVLKTTIETQKWVNNKFQTVNPDAKPIILKLGETSRFVERKESVEDYTNGATKADIYTMVYDYSDIEDIMNMLCPELYDKDASDRTNKVSLMEWVDKNNKWITLWSMIRDDDKD